MQKELPARKHPRLKEYDYSNGYYHVTICTFDNISMLSKVIVGRGLAPADAKIELTTIGKIAEKQLLSLSTRYSSAKIDKYIIMPTHIHAIVALKNEEAAGASPRPTLMDVICVFKSLSTRLCNQNDNIEGRKIWQTSFYDEIIRDKQAYQNIWHYIDKNPAEWAEDEYYK